MLDSRYHFAHRFWVALLLFCCIWSPTQQNTSKIFLTDTSKANFNKHQNRKVFNPFPTVDSLLVKILDDIKTEHLFCEIDDHFKDNCTLDARRGPVQDILQWISNHKGKHKEEQQHVNFSDIGFFFLEIFGTLVGLSWGILSMFM